MSHHRALLTVAAETRKGLHAWLLGRYTANELYDNAVQTRLDGTCDWILTRPSFLDWASPDFPLGSAKVLWINGPAGFGKTVLCARIVEHLSSVLEKPAAHFFFSSDFESRRDPFVAIRSWISQLICHPDVFELVCERWEAQYGQVATHADIGTIFREVVHAVPGCTFIMDGLDECAGCGEGWELDNTSSVGSFLRMVQQAVAGTTTRIMITSRDEPEIRQCIVRQADITTFEYKISPGDVQPDTVLYSRSLVDSHLHNKDENVRGEISQKLATRCQGQFLWLRLQKSELRSGRNKKQLHNAIDKAPTGLERLYDRNWDKILGFPEEERSRTFSLLRWAAFAVRPLTVSEITVAVLIHEDRDDLPLDEMPDSIDEDYVNSEILGLCGSLVEIRSATSEQAPTPDIGLRTVHLAHFSVKQYFISKMPGKEGFLVANEQLRSSHEAIQITELARACLRYVIMPSVWDDVHEDKNHALRSFRDYAAGSWYQHTIAGASNDPDILRLTIILLDPNTAVWDSWREWFDSNNRESANTELPKKSGASSPLYYASLLGLTSTVKYFLRKHKHSANEKGSSGRTILEVACANGHFEVAEMLFVAGADVAMTSDGDWSPLNVASANGFVDLVKLLLSKGADVKVADKNGRTPLNHASHQGHVDVVKLLLDAGADLTTPDKHGWTPLNLASWNGHTEVVELLLNKGVSLSTTTQDGWTPLNLASSNGHTEVVKLLLENEVSLSTASQDGWTPLNLASSDGHTEVVKLLLENGASISTASQDGWTPLNLALSNGHTEVVKLLLENGASISTESQDGWTPLNLASSTGQTEVVKLLLENRANVAVANGFGRTPLHSAASIGHVDVAKLLLKNGADIDVSDNRGRTPLNAGSSVGQTEVVKLLLENGANVAVANDLGRTPLHSAASNGHVDVAKLLLKNGAGIDVSDNYGRTPVSVASTVGHIEMVKLLLEKGADVRDVNNHGWTPLHSASLQGNLEVVKLLLETGADAEATDASGRTSLFLASIMGHVRVVEQLVSSGSLANTKDRYGSMPIFAATKNGHEKVVTCLLGIEGACMDFYDSFGRSLLWWANKSGNTQVTQAVLEFARGRDIQIDDGDFHGGSSLVDMGGSTTWCDVCTRFVAAGALRYVCSICNGGDFDVCLECFEMGAQCHGSSHDLTLREHRVS